MTSKTYYRFGYGDPETEAFDKATLGGKGYALRWMSDMGAPVPPGITIPTDACVQFMHADDPADYVAALVEAIMPAIKQVTVERDGCLFSVRSGARESMPGMMDTILNVGITAGTLTEWGDRLGSTWTAYDCYRRLIEMYGTVVDGIESRLFDEAVQNVVHNDDVHSVSELSLDALSDLCEAHHETYRTATGKDFPDTLEAQLRGAVGAVFDSWNNERAIEYRDYYGIPHEWGTAVNIQSMVFGNLNGQSCTGVLFTRNPSTGENEVTGEWLPKAQGEDVVAGTSTPRNIADMPDWNALVCDKLYQLAGKLELHAGDMQDIEFTVEDGELFLLQTRRGKRSNIAAMVIAQDMIRAGHDTASILGAIDRNVPLRLEGGTVLADDEPATTGLPAGGAPVQGRVFMSSAAAVEAAKDGPVILVAKETTPDDFPGMLAAKGILTAHGGFTSHAAVVSRGLNKTAVVGCSDINVSSTGFKIGGTYVEQGQWVTVDGITGNVWLGTQPIKEVDGRHYLRKLMHLVHANDGLGCGISIKDALPTGLLYYAHHIGHRIASDSTVAELAKLNTLESMVLVDIRDPHEPTEDRELKDFLCLGNAEQNRLSQLHIAGYYGYVLSNLPEDEIAPKGMTKIRKPETVKDLMQGGLFDMDEDHYVRIFGDKATEQTVVAALEAAGHPVKAKPLPDSINLYDFVDTWFSKSE